NDGPSTESLYSDDDSLYEQQRRELENAALVELELAKSKPVCFSVKTNMAFDANLNGYDSPLLDKTVSFAPKEFLHIKTKFDQNWWIGRQVRIGAPLCFIPSAAKLDFIRGHMMPTTDFSAMNPNGTNFQTAANENEPEAFENQEENETVPPTTPGLAGPKKNVTIHPSAPGGAKRKNLFKKAELPPYEIVPIMRPVVIIGPALKGYEVTDLMQKAMFDFIKKHFENRVIISRVSYDISVAKRLTSLQALDKKGPLERNRNRQIGGLS
ncbi:hypothetical protein Ciccas_014262, partial [Cichlidogyrus casuarinus]